MWHSSPFRLRVVRTARLAELERLATLYKKRFHSARAKIDAMTEGPFFWLGIRLRSGDWVLRSGLLFRHRCGGFLL